MAVLHIPLTHFDSVVDPFYVTDAEALDAEEVVCTRFVSSVLGCLPDKIRVVVSDSAPLSVWTSRMKLYVHTEGNEKFYIPVGEDGERDVRFNRFLHAHTAYCPTKKVITHFRVAGGEDAPPWARTDDGEILRYLDMYDKAIYTLEDFVEKTNASYVYVWLAVVS